MVYAEDLQQIWLLDESTKRLIQYNFREDKIMNSYPVDIDFENVTDFLVFNSQIYLLSKTQLMVYNFQGSKISEFPLLEGKRFRRENNNLLAIGKNTVHLLRDSVLKIIFTAENSQIVDKNSAAYFVISANKLYLYPLNK